MDRNKEDYERQKAMSRNWKKQNPERHAELARAYRERNKEKTKAQNLLNYAVRTGKIEREPCAACGTTERVHGHHHDYGKPYSVRWLCFTCHKAEHPVSEKDKTVKFHSAKPASLPGEANPNATLTDKDVRQIRWLIRFKFPQEEIAESFGVSQSHISKIRRGKIWAHVK